jgi:ligand-binding sensor domain-containing protein/serine phosphatase RsbU (regulator of sigma subunit)
MQDNKGFLWVLTQAGISRFDGKEFTNWNKNNGLPSNKTNCIIEGNNGEILIGTKDGLVIFKEGNFEILKIENGLPSNFIRDLQKDDEKIWIGTNKGIRYYQDGIIYKSKIPFPRGDYECRGMAGGGKFPLYVNSQGVIYYLFNNKWDSIVKPDYATISMATDESGVLWIGNWSADYLSKWEDGKLTTYNDFVKGSVTDIYVDSKNRIWVSTWDKGMYKIDNNTFTNYNISNGLESNSYWASTEDDEGNIWFGSFGGGLYKFSEDPFYHFDQNSGLTSTVINALYPDSKGQLWIGTDDGVFVGVPQDDKSFRWVDGPWVKELAGKKIVSFNELMDGSMAIASYGVSPKMVILKNNKLISYDKRIPAPAFCFYEDDTGNLYVGTDFQGIFKTGPDGDKTLKSIDGGNRIINITGDEKNNIWASTHSSGINILIKDSIHVFNEGVIKGTTVSKCLPGFNNDYWISTDEKGIYMVKLNDANELIILDSLNISNGSINNNIAGLRKDSKGRIWVGTEFGIMIISKNSNKLAIKKYSKSEGFTHPECNFDGFAELNNVMYISTSSGITAMEMGVEPRDPKINKLLFKSLQLEYEEVDKVKLSKTDQYGFPELVTFEYNQNHLTFSVNAIHFTKPEQVRFRFRMENLNEKWSPYMKEGRMTYSSIPPGKYILHVESIIKGHKEGVHKKINLIIKPPFWQTIWFIILSIISGILLMIMIYRWRTAKLRNQQIKLEKTVLERTHEIRIQKEIVEEKNQEITDSIAYAKRIQNAILPPIKIVKEYLNESFILYKPKDIVAGDFYWMEIVGDKVLFAAADCTGHGVPGAMVSVVCNNALNRSVREYGLLDPGEILNKTREIIIQEFEKSEEDVKDGMDIALCTLEGNNLQYAGANNSLWIIRKTTSENNKEISITSSKNKKQFKIFEGKECCLYEIKANKQPIGKFDDLVPYATHTFELQKEDSFYIFSDGFPDQFGGPKGKKFMYKPFRELLLSIQDKGMEEQKLLIDEAFELWRGDIEQVDDVCIIGVRI